MTFTQRVDAIRPKGFTERQARFLVTVMLHGGVCMDRQYCAFSGIAHGQKTHDFFARLVARRHAVAFVCAHKRARIFHVRHRALYAAIEEPHSRFRKPTSAGHIVERLMVLDVVLAHRDLTWLATERDKVAHFTLLLHRQLRRHELPHLTFGRGDDTTIRYFPDKLPIGLDPDGRTHVFTYLVTRVAPVDFRAFLHRHAELWRALASWVVRLLVPVHLQSAIDAYVAAWRQELATPLRLAIADELRWFFEQRRSRHEAAPNAGEQDAARYAQGRQAFGVPRFRVLYQSWLRHGQTVIDATVSPALADAIARGTGRLECYVLPHRYLHLSSLVGTA